MEKKFRLGELFCGPGGIALGASLASKNAPNIYLEHTWASDYHSDSCSTYKLNFPHADVICEDVTNLNFIKYLLPTILDVWDKKSIEISLNFLIISFIYNT